MECKKYRELISAYVDGMLSPQEQEKLMAHLKVCETCSEEMSALKQMKTLLEQIEEPELPNEFHEELMKRIKQEEKSPTVHAFKWKWQYSSALVATLMVGILGISQIHSLDRQSRSSAEPIAVAEAGPYMEKESTRSEKTSQDQTQKAQVASENQHVVGRSTFMGDTTHDILQELRWKLDVREKSNFLGQLEAYLKSVGITYEVNKEVVLCYQVTNSQVLMDWIQKQGIKCEGEITEMVVDLVIELEE